MFGKVPVWRSKGDLPGLPLGARASPAAPAAAEALPAGPLSLIRADGRGLRSPAVLLPVLEEALGRGSSRNVVTGQALLQRAAGRVSKRPIKRALKGPRAVGWLLEQPGRRGGAGPPGCT